MLAGKAGHWASVTGLHRLAVQRAAVAAHGVAVVAGFAVLLDAVATLVARRLAPGQGTLPARLDELTVEAAAVAAQAVAVVAQLAGFQYAVAALHAGRAGGAAAEAGTDCRAIGAAPV